MSDPSTRIQELKDKLAKFTAERDWEKFHDPKNLAEALIIEAGELLEHFLWREKEDIAKLLKEDTGYREEVRDEIADVFGYLLHIANVTGIDLSEAIHSKYEKNAKKYPIEKAKGNNIKYTKL